MPRQMSASMLAALTSSLIRPAIFADLEFADGTYYVWSGVGTKTWNGHDYAGLGTFGTISSIEEGGSLEARGVTLSLSAIDPTMLAEALQNVKLGGRVVLYLAAFDSGLNVIADPLVSWAGRMDQPEITLGGSEAMCSIKVESRLLDMNLSCGRRLTLEDAQIENPGDLGLQFVNGLQEVTIYWGTVPQGRGY